MPIGTVDWIEEGMLGDGLRLLPDNQFEFDVRNQFFHGSHPLGWIRNLAVHVNGEECQDLRLIIRGQEVPLDLVRNTSDIWWHPREIAAIRGRAGSSIEALDADVSCTFDVSTFFFTPAIDRNDHYPTMTLTLSGQLDTSKKRTA